MDGLLARLSYQGLAEKVLHWIKRCAVRAHYQLEMVMGAVRKSKTDIILSIYTTSRPNWPLRHRADSRWG
jgi:hypothetical protein